MLIFGIAFGEPPAPIWSDLVSFEFHFVVILRFVGDAAKLQKCNTSQAKTLLGRHLQHFRKLFEDLFGVAVKGAFWGNCCRFGSPKGFLFEFIFSEFADFA